MIAAVADYLVGFPDRCHHPREDLVYRKMCVRDPTLAGTMADLEAEHQKISVLVRQFQEAVQNVLQEVEVSRSAFDEVVHHFVREQRRHMQMEEERFFPLALQILTPDDWVEIDERITREEDPVFGGEVSQEFAALRNDILKWEEEDEALQGWPPSASCKHRSRSVQTTRNDRRRLHMPLSMSGNPPHHPKPKRAGLQI